MQTKSADSTRLNRSAKGGVGATLAEPQDLSAFGMLEIKIKRGPSNTEGTLLL